MNCSTRQGPFQLVVPTCGRRPFFPPLQPLAVVYIRTPERFAWGAGCCWLGEFLTRGSFQFAFLARPTHATSAEHDLRRKCWECGCCPIAAHRRADPAWGVVPEPVSQCCTMQWTPRWESIYPTDPTTPCASAQGGILSTRSVAASSLPRTVARYLGTAWFDNRIG